MDFEMAIWEMTSLLIAPKKVFKSIYYHVSGLDYPNWPSNYADHVIGPRNVSLLIPSLDPVPRSGQAHATMAMPVTITLIEHY
jgi:hypothetical protein